MELLIIVFEESNKGKSRFKIGAWNESDIQDFGQVAFEMRAVKYQRGT